MAEYLLREKIANDATGKIESISAGTDTSGGSPSLSVTVTVMSEIGIDVSAHRSQPVTRKLLEQCDVVLGMTQEHYERLQWLVPDNVVLSTLGAYPGQPSNGQQDIEDPFGQSIDRYRHYRDRIASEIERIFPILISKATKIRS